MNRFFLDLPLHENTTVEIKRELHHMQVLRVEEGEKIELINGKGVLAEATLIFVSKKLVKAKIDKVRLEERGKTHICLAQALIRANRLDFILEKATELGIDEFRFFKAENSEKKEFAIDRATNILIAASKQCKRLFLPSLGFFPNLQACYNKDELALFGNPISPPLSTITPHNSKITIFIGPEQGFSEEELSFLNNVATAVSLNKNILRADTAAITATALLFSIPL